VTSVDPIEGLLILPHLRVQNANAISGSMTWGFPAMTAFMGLMQALERKLPDALDLTFGSVGVICHDFEPQVTYGRYARSFRLTRNPVGKDGNPAAIVEEGRVHLDITLVLGVRGSMTDLGKVGRQAVADEVANILAGLRVAGGSVIPAPGALERTHTKPLLSSLPGDAEKRAKHFRNLRRRWAPGYALVSRQDLLEQRLRELCKRSPDSSLLDAWLDLSRLHLYPDVTQVLDRETGECHEAVEWRTRRPPGWIVPIPVGYGALSPLYPPGRVTKARDSTIPFRFVETLYSIGEWVTPYRLRSPEDMLWRSIADPNAGLYLCRNHYGLSRCRA
jgi:CRISPR-associated protein Csy2